MTDYRKRAETVAELTDYADEDVVLSLLTAEPYYYDHMDNLELAQRIDDNYRGAYEDEKDFAQSWADELGSYKFGQEEWPYNCIDWNEAALVLMQDFFSVKSLASGTVHIFWNH